MNYAPWVMSVRRSTRLAHCPFCTRQRPNSGRSFMLASCQQRKWPASFDHLVSGYEERIGNREAKRLGGFQVDDEPVDRRLLKWQLARLLAAQNTVDVSCSLLKHDHPIRTIRDQCSGCHKHRIE